MFNKVLVTGGAGFIGSNLVDRLLAMSKVVIVYDNFSTGCQEFLKNAESHQNFRLIKGDVLEINSLSSAMKGVDFVFHLAANADVRFGPQHPKKDLEQNTLATFNVLEAMRQAGVSRMAFASTGSVYGEATVFPTPENAPFPVQTSFYGASKLAGESLIEAYCEAYHFRSYIFRFVSILGERYTHGHAVDFYRQLLAHPDHLKVLGNGKQKKSYLYIQDCLEAMLCVIANAKDRVNCYNLGTDEYSEVNDSILWITDYLNLSPKIIYAGSDRGWIGDNPFIFLDCAKLRELGWRPQLTIQEGFLRTLKFLRQNMSLLDKRESICV